MYINILPSYIIDPANSQRCLLWNDHTLTPSTTTSLGLAPLGKTAALGTVLKGTSDEFNRPCRLWESLPKAVDDSGRQFLPKI